MGPGYEKSFVQKKIGEVMHDEPVLMSLVPVDSYSLLINCIHAVDLLLYTLWKCYIFGWILYRTEILKVERFFILYEDIFYTILDNIGK